MIENNDVNLINRELGEPFDGSVIKQLRKGNANLDYIPYAEVVARMNFVLGTQNWSVLESHAWIEDNHPEWVLARVTVEATIGANTTTKIGYGGQKIKMMKNGAAVDLGDEYKGAASDAFKKACQQFGVGLELARTEEALENEQNEQYRLETEGKPKASDEQLSEITDLLGKLTDDQKVESKNWWKKEEFSTLKSGNLLEEEAVHIIKYLNELIEKEAPFTDE